VSEARVEACGPEDASLIADVGERTFRETYSADTPADELERHVASAYAVATIERELGDPDSSFFLARVDGDVAGYLKINRGAAQTELREDAGLEIESLYVLREFQGRRIGQLLFDRALDEARTAGAEYVWLGVWERNEMARRFWAKQGFVEFDSHPFRFGEVEHNDLMMRRPLGSSAGRAAR
jgi:ribosomal protein S18 acetylase RimI-like enzyme